MRRSVRRRNRRRALAASALDPPAGGSRQQHQAKRLPLTVTNLEGDERSGPSERGREAMLWSGREDRGPTDRAGGVSGVRQLRRLPCSDSHGETEARRAHESPKRRGPARTSESESCGVAVWMGGTGGSDGRRGGRGTGACQPARRLPCNEPLVKTEGRTRADDDELRPRCLQNRVWGSRVEGGEGRGGWWAAGRWSTGRREQLAPPAAARASGGRAASPRQAQDSQADLTSAGLSLSGQDGQRARAPGLLKESLPAAAPTGRATGVAQRGDI